MSRTFLTGASSELALPHIYRKIIHVCKADPKALQDPKVPFESSKNDSLRSGWFSC